MSTATERIANQRNAQNTQESTSFIRGENARVNAWETGLAYAKNAVNNAVDGAVGIQKAVKAKTTLDAGKIYDDKMDSKLNDEANRILLDISNPNSGITYEEAVTRFQNYSDNLFNEVYGNLGWNERNKAIAKEAIKSSIDKYISKIDSARVPLLAKSIDNAMNSRIDSKLNKIASGELDAGNLNLGESKALNIMERNFDEIPNIFNDDKTIDAYKASVAVKDMSFEDGAKHIKENYPTLYANAKENGMATAEEIVSFVNGEASSKSDKALFDLVMQDNIEDIFEYSGSYQYAMEHYDELKSNTTIAIALGNQSTNIDNLLANNEISYDELGKIEIDKNTIDPCTGSPYTEYELNAINIGIKSIAKQKIEADKAINKEVFDNKFLPALNESINSGEIMTSGKIADLFASLGIKAEAIDEQVLRVVSDIGKGFDNKQTVEDLIRAGTFSKDMPSNALSESLRYYIYNNDGSYEIGVNESATVANAEDKTISRILALNYKPSVVIDKKTGATQDQIQRANDEYNKILDGHAEKYYEYKDYSNQLAEVQDSKMFGVDYSTVPKNKASLDKLTDILFLLGYDSISEDGSMYRIEGKDPDIEKNTIVIKGRSGKESKYTFRELYNLVERETILASKVTAYYDPKTGARAVQKEDSDDIRKEKKAIRNESEIESKDVVQREEGNTIDFVETYNQFVGQLELRAESDIWENFEKEVEITKAEVAPYSTELNKKYGITDNSFNAKSLVDSSHQRYWNKMVEAYEQNGYGVVKPQITKTYSDGRSYLNYYLDCIFETNDDGTLKYNIKQLQESIKSSPYVSASDTKKFVDADFNGLMDMAKQRNANFGSLQEATNEIAKINYGANPTEAQLRTVAEELLNGLANRDPNQSIQDFFAEVTARVKNSNGRTLLAINGQPTDWSNIEQLKSAGKILGEKTINGTTPYALMGHNALAGFDKYIETHINSDESLYTLLNDPKEFVKNDQVLWNFCYHTACALDGKDIGVDYKDKNFPKALTDFMGSVKNPEEIAGDAGALFTRIKQYAELKEAGWDLQEYSWTHGSAKDVSQRFSSKENPIALSGIKADGTVEGTESVKAKDYTITSLVDSSHTVRNQLEKAVSGGEQIRMIVESGQDINGILYALCPEARRMNEMNMELKKAGKAEYIPQYRISSTNVVTGDENEEALESLLSDLQKQYERGLFGEDEYEARKKELIYAGSDSRYARARNAGSDIVIDIVAVPADEYIDARELANISTGTIESVIKSNQTFLNDPNAQWEIFKRRNNK